MKWKFRPPLHGVWHEGQVSTTHGFTTLHFFTKRSVNLPGGFTFSSYKSPAVYPPERFDALYEELKRGKMPDGFRHEAGARFEQHRVSSLRRKLIRLAHAQPELRPYLLPLLAKQANRQTAIELLEEYQSNPTTTNKVELSDWGINTFRAEARKAGYDRSAMLGIFKEESTRVRGLPPNGDGLLQYLKMRRAGSKYRMNRKMRVGLFVQLAAKGVI